MPFSAANQYKQNSIATATPEELTLLLYNGAIKFMNIGKLKMEEKDINGKHNALLRAQDIILELKIALNMDYEISKELEKLYDFVLERLVSANMENDPKIIDEALEIVQDMRMTWKTVMEEVKKPGRI